VSNLVLFTKKVRQQAPAFTGSTVGVYGRLISGAR